MVESKTSININYTRVRDGQSQRGTLHQDLLCLQAKTVALIFVQLMRATVKTTCIALSALIPFSTPEIPSISAI
ncbi:hypothetical protein SUGI_1172070 [Cryptomeria japonica]|nr:hypothetical protein SUGI_1172070 [Cryptomeria japonica]